MRIALHSFLYVYSHFNLSQMNNKKRKCNWGQWETNNRINREQKHHTEILRIPSQPQLSAVLMQNALC